MKIKFLEKCVIRYSNFSNNDEFCVDSLLANEEKRAAIEHTSTSFLNELQKNGVTKKTEESIYGYLNRMYYRNTPFGLFSTSKILNFSFSKDINRVKTLIVNDVNKKNIYLDNNILYSIYENIIGNNEIKIFSIFFLNQTIYNLNDNFNRFYKFRLKDRVLEYTISEFETSEIIEQVLNIFEKGCSFFHCYNQIGRLIEIEYEEFLDFAFSLVEEGLLISEYNLSTNNYNYLKISAKKLLRLENKSLTPLIEDLTNLDNIIENFNLKNENYKEVSNQIKSILNNLNVLIEKENEIINIDCLSEQLIEYNLPIKYKKNIEELVHLLPSINDTTPPPRLIEFKKQFKLKYKYKKVPLLIALDTDLGIGNIYEKSNQTFAKQKETIQLSSFELFLIKKILSKKDEIDISDFPNSGIQSKRKFLTMNFGFSIYKTIEEDILKFNGLYGPSSINMHSRFMNLNQNFNNLVNEIKNEEIKHQNFVQISHISDLRALNISQHPKITSKNIPIAINPSKDYENLKLNNLLIYLEDDVLIIYDKKSKKKITPRIYSSLNTELASIPLFRFLTELILQENLKDLYFNWGGVINIFDYFPRVYFKNILISPKVWKINTDSLTRLTGFKDVIGFLGLLGVSEAFYLIGDNDVFFDLKSEFSMKIFSKKIKKKKNFILLKEFIAEVKESVVTERNNPLSHEFLLPIFFESTKVKGELPLDLKEDLIQKSFLPFNEWIYIKMYCNESTSTSILINIILPLVDSLLDKRQINNWHFVRYEDEKGFHLRIRFSQNKTTDLQNIISQISAIADELLVSFRCFSFEYATYNRELERYGAENIKNIESFFTLSSNHILAYLKNTDIEDVFVFGFLLLDHFLNLIDFNINEKLRFCEYNYNQFEIELGLKNEKKKMSQDYRNKRELIEENKITYKKNSHLYEQKYSEIFKLIRINIKDDKQYIDIVWSLIHMSFNKLFMRDPRRKEAYVYNFALRYYTSTKARLK